MKKITLFFLLLIMLFVPSKIVVAESELPTETIIVHYFRFSGDYKDWNFWIWPYQPVGGEGSAYQLATNDGEYLFDDFGSYAIIDASKYKGSTSLGIIVRKGDWAEKDISQDRHFDLPDTSPNGVHHIYLVQNDVRIGYQIDDPNGPEKTDRLLNAYFKTEYQINFLTTKAITKDQIELTIDGVITDFNYQLTNLNGVITLSNKVDLTKNYVLKINFGDNIKQYDVTFDGIYDSPSFEEAFAYDGNDLGAIIVDNQTHFCLWAPIASSVKLNLYSTGSPTRSTTGITIPNGKDTPDEVISMTKDVKGTWVVSINENLHGTYYTYSVTNGSLTHEVIDPYAKTTGINGVRGMVIDFNQVNPIDFNYNTRANNMVNATDAIIYELHVRDLTSHSSWNGTSVNRAKYLGLIEKDTSYKGVTTGFDHILELGVTHVQLLPFFDFGVVDEVRVNETKYQNMKVGAFNWGYMPMNFNALEGSYSSNPYDGAARVTEMKTVVTEFTKNNLRLNMDVVYNHTGESSNSNFHLILPGYYHRMTSTGNFSNGSGTGNETASERYMMRKFMVDSVIFWATEYNISGFRFDLMALHDTETMNQIVTKLRQIDPTIMVYGEPWNGGQTPLSSNIAADKQNLSKMPSVGAFNDDTRDGIKGSVFNAKETGFVQGNIDVKNMQKIKYGVVGGIAYPGLASNNLSYQMFWHTSPLKTINYVACHDNNTLYDKLMLSTTIKQKEYIPMMVKLANAIVLTSQGVAFIHAGDEFMRSKPAFDGIGYDSNSYESPDSTNQMRWDIKAKDENLDVFNYYKGMIALRKAHPAFRMTTSLDIINNLTFMYEDNNKLIAYSLNNNAGGDNWKRILVIHNSSLDQTVKLPSGDDWHLVANSRKVSSEAFRAYKAGSDFTVWQYETVILYQAPSQIVDPTPPKSGCGSKTALLLTNLITVMALGTFIIKKKSY